MHWQRLKHSAVKDFYLHNNFKGPVAKDKWVQTLLYSIYNFMKVHAIGKSTKCFFLSVHTRLIHTF